MCSKHCASSRSPYRPYNKEKAKYNLAFCYLDDADCQIQLFVMELM